MGSILALFLLEGAVRLALMFVPDHKLPTYGIYQKSDPVLGHKLLPNLKGVWNREGFSIVETNSQGWNDYERAFEKPVNTVRIAIVGDSFVEALQVDKSKTLGKMTENWLNSNCPYKINGSRETYEVLLFGASSWGTAQMYLASINEVILFDPDYVVVAFFPGNDLKNNIYVVEGDPYKPYFEITDDNQILLIHEPSRDNSLTKSIYRWGRNRSRVIQLSREFLIPFVEKSKAKRLESLVSQQEGSNEKRVDQLINEGIWGINGETEFVENAWLLAERLLLETKLELKSFGIEMMILVVSEGQVVDREQEVVRKWAEEKSITNLFYPEDRLEDFGMENDILIIPVGKDMAFHNWSENGVITSFHGFGNQTGDGHWNENGHAFVGETIGKKICEDLDNTKG